MNRVDKVSLMYWLIILMLIVVITIATHGLLSFKSNPQVYYAVGAIWTLLFAGLVFLLFRKDIENQTHLQLARYVDISSELVLNLRKVEGLILKSETQDDIDRNTATGIRAILNLAHEYFSFITGVHCTSTIGVIVISAEGKDVCRIVQYDDFVPSTRREKEVEIPIEKSLFGEIRDRDLGAVIIDDYTESKYPIQMVPIIEEGFCVSGICAPIKVFNETTAYFNIDTTKRNAFRINSHDKTAKFFAELIGSLMQVGEIRTKEIRNEERKRKFRFG